MAKNPNKEEIKALKAKLAKGVKSQKKFDSIIQQIRDLGGKVAPKNFPQPTKPGGKQDTTTPAAPSPQSPSGKQTAEQKAKVKKLKDKLAKGNLSAAQFDKIIDKIRNELNGKVGPKNFDIPQGSKFFKGSPSDPKAADPVAGGQEAAPLDPEDTPIAGGITGVEGGPTSQEQINQLVEEIAIGEQLGQGIIESQGLEGEFLGRIDEDIGPEQQA